MDRRHFLQALGASTSLASLPTWAGSNPAADTADRWQTDFDAARATTPWTAGFAGLQADVPPLALRLRGRLPPDLGGTFYRNGPARYGLGGIRYHHWFDGDGMVQAYRIENGGITHQGRFVRTSKFVADTRAGRPVRPVFATDLPDTEPLNGPDAMNVANTSVVRIGDDLMALWEGGSAIRMDPQTLETRGPKTWSADYEGMPFSAHPRVEPKDGSLWNFGVSSGPGLLSIYHVSADGKQARMHTLKVPDIGMVHDFAITQRHLVFLMPPLVYDAARSQAGQTFLDSHVWRPELGMRVLLLPKDRLDAPQWLQLPAGFVFHLGNAWEEPNGRVIHLDYVHSDDAQAVFVGVRNMMRGHLSPTENTQVARVTLDLARGRATQQQLAHASEFPRIDPRIVGSRHREVILAERVDRTMPRPGWEAVMRLNLDTGAVDRYSYGPDVMAEEHIYVPRTDRAGRPVEGQGWVLGTALDLKQQAMLFSVFDARRIAAGPVAQGTLARVMPLGLHAIFTPSA
ncbi:MAG: carotenoid oxygenase family protein [Proteobacteria bacterium]|nr:carotenoid oxygenase family protein [Pseudomonadota bacterium]